jgi:hypothetical protein
MERVKQLKHQQLVSGMSNFGYWVANALWDILAAYIPIVLMIMLSYGFTDGI